jgi:hypothetical protein
VQGKGFTDAATTRPYDIEDELDAVRIMARTASTGLPGFGGKRSGEKSTHM